MVRAAKVMRKCALCKGDGYDLTGKMVNGSPKPVCVRCGGYGSIPKSGRNTHSLTSEENKQIAFERKESRMDELRKKFRR